MGVVTRAKKRKLEEEEEEHLEDRISRLPDGILGDIITLLPTKDGARTQVLSSRWRRIWRSAPLNLALDALRLNADRRVTVAAGEISRILTAHPGPCRRFCTIFRYLYPDDNPTAATAALLDGWLRSPALDGLQELEFHFGSYWFPLGWSPPQLLLVQIRRFSSTLRATSFSGCAFPEGNAAGDLHLPVLKKLSLVQSMISESSLQALIAGCPVLESLLLFRMLGFSCLRIVSSRIRSIVVHPGPRGDRYSGGNRILQHLVLQDAPCLERLLLFSCGHGMVMDISVISAPKLSVLGALSDDFDRAFQGQHVTVVPRIKILALANMHLRLEVVINFLKCFPCLEELCIKTIIGGHKNEWGDEYWNLVISTLDVRVKKVTLLNYRDDTSHINFAKFFVLNARVLESMVLELENGMMLSTEWIEKQHEHLHTNNRASSGAQFDFVRRESRSYWMPGYGLEAYAHDLSTVDPFVRFSEWLN